MRADQRTVSVATGRLDLDHVGAEVREDGGGAGTGEIGRRVDHPYVFQQVVHVPGFSVLPGATPGLRYCLCQGRSSRKIMPPAATQPSLRSSSYFSS